MRKWVFILGLIGQAMMVCAQAPGYHLEGQPSATIPVTASKMTNLIFPEAIRVGVKVSREIDVRKVRGVDSVIELKAVNRHFANTNLSVYGMGGRLYSFVLQYVEDTAVLNFRVVGDRAVARRGRRDGNVLENTAHLSGEGGSNKSDSNRLDSVGFVLGARGESDDMIVEKGNDEAADLSAPLHLSGLPVSRTQLREDASLLAGEKPFLHRSCRTEAIRLRLRGIYLRDGLEWLVFDLSNRSAIDYRPVFARYFLQDRRRLKRSAVQEVGLQPIYSGVPGFVKDEKQLAFAVGFEPFTIPPGKQLVVQFAGKDGERNLVLHVKGKLLLRARKD